MYKSAYKFSESIGVPKEILNLENGCLSWIAKFEATIHNTDVEVEINSLACFIELNDKEILLLKVGSEIIDSQFGKIYHISLVSSEIDGYCQFFRMLDKERSIGIPEYAFSHTDTKGNKYHKYVSPEFIYDSIND
jgi:hypothetical protein